MPLSVSWLIEQPLPPPRGEDTSMARSVEQTGSPDWRAKSPTDQARVEVPKLEHEAEARGDVSTDAAPLEAIPMPPGHRKEAMLTTEMGSPSGLHKIKCTIRRSSK